MKENDKIIGLVLVYVDDILYSGTVSFLERFTDFMEKHLQLKLLLIHPNI